MQESSGNSSDGGLKPRQTRAIEVLLSGAGVEKTAKLLKVNPRTVYVWLRDPDFKAVLRERQRQAMDDATSKLQAAAGEAVDTLQEVMRDKLAPHSAKVSAARTILETGFRWIDPAKSDSDDKRVLSSLTIEQLFQLMQGGKQ